MPPPTEPLALEFIGAKRNPGTKPVTGSRLAMLAAILGCILLVYLASGPDVRAGTLYPQTTPYIGDPFAVEWVPLKALADGQPSYERPLPMAGDDPICIGFGRIDWPPENRQPTVAFCFAEKTTEQLPADGAMILDDVLAGNDTWYLMLFGSEVSHVEVLLGSASVAPEKTYVNGRFAGVLVPTGSEPSQVLWTVKGGPSYATSMRPRQDSNLQSTG